MATSLCRTRLLGSKEKDLLLKMLGQNGFEMSKNNIEIVELHAKITTPSDSKTEIAAPTTVFDGTTTPALLAVRSTSATDTDDAAGAVRAVEIHGFGTGTSASGTVVGQKETIRMNGLTPVYSTKYWVRVLHIKAVEWGSAGYDAAGIIQLGDIGSSTSKAEITTITATNSLLLADQDWFSFYDFNSDTFVSTRYNVWINKSGGAGAPVLDGTEIEVDISGTEAAQVSIVTAKAPGVAEVSTIEAVAPGVAEVSTILAKTFGTAEVSTIVADTFANCIDGSYITLYGIDATYADKGYYVWLDKVGDESGDPAPGSLTEIRCDISGDVSAQDVSDTITAAITAQGDFGAANGGGTSTTITITCARKGDTTNIADVDTGLAVATTTPGVTNMPDGSYIVLYGINSATKAEKGYYVWFDKRGDDGADPAPGGGLTECRCDISGDTTAQDISDTITTAINALDEFGAANGGGTSETVTITNAILGACTNIADNDSTLTVATTTPGVTNIADGSYLTIHGIDSATKVETDYYVWFDWVGDESADPEVADYTEIRCDISADVTAQNVSDCITAAITAKADFGAANGGGTLTTITITNAILGPVTNIADNDTGLAVAVGTPGSTNIADGSYFILHGINGSGVETDYYVWFDWVGDESGDPEIADHTEIRCDISADVSVANVADCISTAIDAKGDFGAADDGTDVTITNANDGDCTDLSDDGSTGLTMSVDTQGGSTATQVATAIVTAINGSAALITAAETTYPAFTLTNDVAGPVTDTAEGAEGSETGFNFVKTQDGDGPSSLYLQIAATFNESNNSRIYVPDGFFSIIKKLLIGPKTDLGDNGTKITISKIGFENANNLDATLDIDEYTIWDLLPFIDIQPDYLPRQGTDAAYYKFEEVKVTAAVATDLKVLIFLLK